MNVPHPLTPIHSTNKKGSKHIDTAEAEKACPLGQGTPRLCDEDC